MENLLSSLTSPIAIGVILIVLVLLVAVPIMLRRRRGSTEEEPPDLGTPIDYTSLPVEETPTLRDRFSNLSLAGKILVFVVPLLVIVAVIVLLLLLPPANDNNIASGPPTPTLEPDITITGASLARVSPGQQITIEADSTLAPGTEVRAELYADDEPFPWYDPPSATTTVAGDGSINVTLNKTPDAPAPTRDMELTTDLQATLGEDLQVTSNRQNVSVPDFYAEQFYTEQVAAAPTETAEPTVEPTTVEAEPTPEETEEVEPTVAPTTPSVDIDQERAAIVSNGGNVRKHPLLIDNVIGQINAGEQVEIIGRTPNGEWYRIKNERGVIGWSSITLLNVPAQVAQRMPVLPIVTVFTSGNVYEQPSARGTPLDQVFRGETVDLLKKTPNGDWYQVRTVRDEIGWVDASLLGIPPEVADEVEVDSSQQSEPPAAPDAQTPDDETAPTEPTEEDTSEPTTPPTGDDGTSAVPPDLDGLTARVFSNGSIREMPNLDAAILGEINAGKNVELLQKTANATWYRIKNDVGVEGWVSSRLLTIAPEVQEKVPVT